MKPKHIQGLIILFAVYLMMICFALFDIANNILDIEIVVPNVTTMPQQNEPQISASTTPEEDYIEIGITEERLIEIMGNPTEKLKGDGDKQVWYYGQANVFLDDGVVTDFDNHSNLLKVKPTPTKK